MPTPTHRPGLVLEHEAVRVAGSVGDVRHHFQAYPPKIRDGEVDVVAAETVGARGVSIGLLRYLQQPATGSVVEVGNIFGPVSARGRAGPALGGGGTVIHAQIGMSRKCLPNIASVYNFVVYLFFSVCVLLSISTCRESGIRGSAGTEKGQGDLTRQQSPSRRRGDSPLVLPCC